MAKMPLRDWLESREPRVPAAFLGQLLPDEAEAVDISSLVGLGQAALKRSLTAKGKERRAAFDLLAADAFITYACEHAARASDVDSAFVQILDSVGGRPS